MAKLPAACMLQPKTWQLFTAAGLYDLEGAAALMHSSKSAGLKGSSLCVFLSVQNRTTMSSAAIFHHYKLDSAELFVTAVRHAVKLP